ncbi:hypothetical protein E4U46_000205 [Claviceps purpurea]|nr:hypothetical protein E4U46_000205 [Claviceps purpurea]
MVGASKPLVERHAVQPPCMMQLVSCDTLMITEYTTHGLMTCRPQQRYHRMQIERTDKPSLTGWLQLAFPGDAHSTGFTVFTEYRFPRSQLREGPCRAARLPSKVMSASEEISVGQNS